MQKIAGKLTIKDWQELVNKLDNTKPENWGNAFNFFEQRIVTRYLNPINAILNMDLKTGEGFAVVNLQCSLIETIESFYKGCIYKFDHHRFEDVEGNKVFKKNWEIFKSFFDNREPFKALDIEGYDFYENVRCGLLHDTQTKNGWVIKAESDKIFEIKGMEKIIYRTNFQKGIEKVIKKYKSDLISSSEANDLRANFRWKFNNICYQSKVK